MWVELTDLNGEMVTIRIDTISILETARRDQCDVTLVSGRVISVKEAREEVRELIHAQGVTNITLNPNPLKIQTKRQPKSEPKSSTK